MRFIEERNEVCPDLTSRVLKIWNDCGTYVTSQEPSVTEKEIEFFIELLIENISDDFMHHFDGSETPEEFLRTRGYTR